MKESTKRRVTRSLGDRFNIAVGVIATGLSIAILFVQPSSVWVSLALVLLVVGAAMVVIALHLYASAPALRYFEEVSFGEPAADPLELMDNLVILAVQGLINYEKARPEFVHAAPKNKEVKVVCQALSETGFSTLYGGPGEGKSMTAYHAAYQLHKEAGYSPYALRVDLLRDKSGQEFCDDLLEQLDKLKGKKLVIVDDAHKLAERVGLNRLMRREACDGLLKVIWVETEFYEEIASQRHTSDVRIDFRDFGDKLVANLYRSQNVDLQYALQGKVEGLDEAIRMAAARQIRDAWHFAFVASHGEERVEEEIRKLDYAETLVLFLISAYTVVSGEAELSTAKLMNLLATLEFGWLTDALRHRRLSDIIRSLQEYRFESPPDKQTVQRLSLIRLYDKTVNDRGYVESLHYNSARAIVTAALLRTAIAENLMESLRVLLTSDYRRCVFMAMLLQSLGPLYAPKFLEANEKWFVGFLSNPLPDMIGIYAPLLSSLKGWHEDAHRRVLHNLDLDRLACGASAIDAGGFASIANLLHALKDRRGVFLEKVVWQDLATRFASADVLHFQQVANLLAALGDRRDVLLDKVDEVAWQGLANRVTSADATQFEQVAHLINALGNGRDALLDKVAWQGLANCVAKAETWQFNKVAELLNALGNKRNALLDAVGKVDKSAWQGIANQVAKAKVGQFGEVAHLLNAVGNWRNVLLNMVDKVDKNAWQGIANQVAKAEPGQFGEVAHFLNALANQRDAFLDMVGEDAWQALANQMAKAEVGQFAEVAHLLNALGKKRNALLDAVDKVDKSAWRSLADQVAKAEGAQFTQVVNLLHALGDRRDALMEKLDTTSLAGTANHCSGEDLKGLTMLIANLDDERRSALIGGVEWSLLCVRCPIEASLLQTLGSCLENVWRKAEMCQDPSGCQVTAAYLNGQREALLLAVNESFTNARKNPWAYAGPAKLLFNCHKIVGELALKIAEQTTGTFLQSFIVNPANYRYVGQLINALHEVSPDLANAFLQNQKVRGRIVWSLNKQDWARERMSARHRIRPVNPSFAVELPA